MNREGRRQLIFKFGREKITYKNYFYKIILNSKKDDIDRVLKSINRNYIYKKKLETILFPKSLEELSFNKMIYDANVTKEILDEFCERTILQFSEKINSFIILKEEYEKFVFLENYEQAYLTINKIEDEICISFWSCGQKMMLVEKLYGLEENKKLMSEFLNITKQNLLINTLIIFRSLLVENNTSYVTYQDQVNEYLNSVKDEEVIYKYYNFKLNLNNDFDTSIYSIAIQFDCQLSIIDLYESFVYFTQLNFMKSSQSINISTLSAVIKDFRIRNIKILKDNNEFKKYISNNTNYYTELEEYSKGNYKQFTDRIQKYLLKYPGDFQTAILYIKSIVNAGYKLDNIPKIYVDIYNIYSMNEHISNSISSIYNYIKIYQGTSWEGKIKGFISRKISLENTNKYNYFSCLNDYHITPNFVKCLRRNEEQLQFLKLFLDVCPTTAGLYMYSLSFSDNLPPFLNDEMRKKLFEADRQMKLGNVDEAIEILLKKKTTFTNLYNLERINNRLVNAYKNKHEYLTIIVLLVDAYLINSNLIRRINLNKLLEEIKTNNTKLLKSSIYFVIYTYICDKNNYNAQRIAYSNYMNLNNFRCIEDILCSGEKRHVLVYFLHKVCTQYLIKRDIILNTSW